MSHLRTVFPLPVTVYPPPSYVEQDTVSLLSSFVTLSHETLICVFHKSPSRSFSVLRSIWQHLPTTSIAASFGSQNNFNFIIIITNGKFPSEGPQGFPKTAVRSESPSQRVNQRSTMSQVRSLGHWAGGMAGNTWSWTEIIQVLVMIPLPCSLSVTVIF